MRLPNATAAGLAGLIPLLAPAPARAELLYFARGGQLQAPAAVRDGAVRVETPAGVFTFLESDFLKIAPGGCPEREWVPRRDAALRGDAEARFAAAWWALENGLVPESVAMLRATHAGAPTHQPAARLVALLDRLESPCPDPETEPLRTALAVPLDAARGPHTLLLHQLKPDEAQARVDFLERIVTAYYLTLAAHGIELPPLPHRLVSVHLRDRNDYLAFLHSQRAGAFETTYGYFHPTYRAVITFDVRSTGKWKAARPEPARPAPDRRGSVTADVPDPRRRDDQRRWLLEEMDCRAVDLGTAAHETVHLLVTASGLSPRPGAFPLWLHEGFAAQFEVVRGGRWSGIGRAHDRRLPDWRSIAPPPDLDPLISDDGFGHGYRRVLYARSWALVYFLRKTRPHEFHAYLDRLRLPSLRPDPPSAPDRFRTPFRSAFGDDLSRLQTEWHTYLSQVRTPLEDASPPVSPRFETPRD